MRACVSVVLIVAAAIIPLSATAQRTAVPLEGVRIAALTVTSFKINGGAPSTGDRDITYEIRFEGTNALYRIADGARPTSGWLLASQGVATGPFQLIRGLEGTRTLYLEIRRDATSPTTVTTATVSLQFPDKDVGVTGREISDVTVDGSGYSTILKKTSSTGYGCYFSAGDLSAWGNFPAAAALGIPVAPSPETICEITILSGKNLKPGWSVKSVSMKLVPNAWNVTVLDGSRCEVKSAAFGTNVPAVKILVRHPGSLNPLASVATKCQLNRVYFSGPDDPDVVEGLADIL